ncbi:MAG: hypothetical protein PHT19_02515 [Methylococcus sp.]|nr:hypothetical protein [Methylococcus sp.]
MSALLPPLKPIAMKERVSLIFVERGEIDVLDGAFVVVDKTGVRTHFPVGSMPACCSNPVPASPTGRPTGLRGRNRRAVLGLRPARQRALGPAAVSGQAGAGRRRALPTPMGMNHQ